MTLTSSEYDKLSSDSRCHLEELFDMYMYKYFVKASSTANFFRVSFSSVKKSNLCYQELSKFFDIERESQRKLAVHINEKLAQLIDYIEIATPSNPFNNIRDSAENRCLLLSFSKNGNLSHREIDSSFRISNWNSGYIRYVYKNRDRYILRWADGELYGILKSDYNNLKESVILNEINRGLNNSDNIDAFLSQIGFSNGNEVINSIKNGIVIKPLEQRLLTVDSNPLDVITENNIDNAIQSSVNALKEIEQILNALKYAKLITKKNGEIKKKYEAEVYDIVSNKFSHLSPF